MVEKAEKAVLDALHRAQAEMHGLLHPVEDAEQAVGAEIAAGEAAIKADWGQVVKLVERIEHEAAERGLRVVKIVADCLHLPDFYPGIYGGAPVEAGDKLEITLSDGSKA